VPSALDSLAPNPSSLSFAFSLPVRRTAGSRCRRRWSLSSALHRTAAGEFFSCFFSLPSSSLARAVPNNSRAAATAGVTPGGLRK
jgi:hypothetical protein